MDGVAYARVKVLDAVCLREDSFSNGASRISAFRCVLDDENHFTHRSFSRIHGDMVPEMSAGRISIASHADRDLHRG